MMQSDADDRSSDVVACGRCGASWSSPSNLTHPVAARIAKLVREHRTIEAIKLLRDHTGLSPRDAKGIIQHISPELGVCHRCRSTLGGSGVVTCPKCGSLNYDW
jgi:ribosomal protein L40E